MSEIKKFLLRIKEILTEADLESVTSKVVRSQVSTKDQYDNSNFNVYTYPSWRRSLILI